MRKSASTRSVRSVSTQESVPSVKKSVSSRNRASKARGTANERKLVNDLKAAGHEEARRVIGSGRYASHKGDVELRHADTLLEAKVYQTHVNAAGAKIISIDLEWIPKAEQEAEDMHFKHSAVIVRPKGPGEWFAMLSKKEYLKYLEYCKL